MADPITLLNDLVHRPRRFLYLRLVQAPLNNHDLPDFLLHFLQILVQNHALPIIALPIIRVHLRPLNLTAPEAEKAPKFEQELLKNEIGVELQLARARQLVEHVAVGARIQKHVAIVVPDEIHLVADVPLQVLVDGVTIVELRQQNEELLQLVLQVTVLVQHLDFHYHCLQLAHEVAEDHDAEEQEEGADYPLNIIPRMVVPEAHRAKRCH